MNKEELYAEAKRLNIPGRSKMTANELREAIANTGTKSVNPITRDTPLMDRVGPTAIVEHHERTTTIDDTHDTGRFFAFPDPSPEAQHRMEVPSNYAGMDKRKEVERRHRHGKLNTDHKDERRMRASQSRRYGQGGRGMGAKHYPNRLTEPLSRAGSGKGGGRGTAESVKPLSYADRVRHYAKQNDAPEYEVSLFPGVLLTSKQWRRAEKKLHTSRGRKYKVARYGA